MKYGLTMAQAAEARNIGFVKFSVRRAKTVGGPIEIAAITKHEGFKWIERRHFYPPELNPAG
jgi:hypothetical protein